jgi:DNA-binding XRE family transcriptional regulator
MSTVITVDQTRRARRELKLTQAALADATGLSANSIKLFETYRYKPAAPFLTALAEFFEAQGLDLAAADSDPEPASARPGMAKLARADRSCFLISDNVPQEVVDRAIDKMIDIDAEVDRLFASSVSTGLLGGLSQDSQGVLREVYALMAQGYLMFRLLQGETPLKSVATPEVIETISDVISQLTGPVMAEVTAGNTSAIAGGSEA